MEDFSKEEIEELQKECLYFPKLKNKDLSKETARLKYLYNKLTKDEVKFVVKGYFERAFKGFHIRLIATLVFCFFWMSIHRMKNDTYWESLDDMIYDN